MSEKKQEALRKLTNYFKWRIKAFTQTKKGEHIEVIEEVRKEYNLSRSEITEIFEEAKRLVNEEAGG